jgi:predicted transcriptional regulator
MTYVIKGEEKTHKPTELFHSHSLLSPSPSPRHTLKVRAMAIRNSIEQTKPPVEHSLSVETIMGMEERCRACKPSSVLDCVSKCRIWKLKNESRQLNKKMRDPSFAGRLFNTLKNKRRLQLLETLSKGRFSADKLQKELKQVGFMHSQKTIEEEYVQPLLQAELVGEEYGKYYATAFGYKVSELVKGSEEMEKVLPSHSEGYEEAALLALLNKPRIYEDFRELIPEKSAARVVSRLQKAALVETSKDKDHVFFFRTQRNQSKEKLSPTEKKTYESIPKEGISARRLTEKAGISLRRTYKYLRKLKGKKLVFTREKPRVYALTTKGMQIACTVQSIQNLLSETLAAVAQLENEQKPYEPQVVSVSQAVTGDKAKTTADLPPAQYAS